MTKEMDENLMWLIVCDGEQQGPLGSASDNVLFPISTKYNISVMYSNRKRIACCIIPGCVFEADQPKSKHGGMMRTKTVQF